MNENNDINDRFSILRKYDIEPIRGAQNQRIYSIARYNKVIAFRKCQWSYFGKNHRYARFSVNPKIKPDLIILTVESKNIYIFPLYNPDAKVQRIPEYKLQPFQNRFDFIELDIKDITIIKNGHGITPYRSVKKENGWYYSSIIINKESIRLGRYSTALKAAEVYDKAALYFCPPNLRTNKIQRT